MSTDLATMFSGAMTPVEGLDEDTLAVAGGARSNKRISIKGGVFRKYSGGKEIGAIEDRHMNVIFVKMAHKASRMFYEGVYQEGQKISPNCWSTDSETPDADVKAPVASKCADCDKAVKGSGQGGSGTACRLSWRTAVVLPNDPAGDVYQLVLPATSAFGKEENGRWPFRPYIQMLANNNVSAGRIVTKMEFDTNSSTPKLLFSPQAAVPADAREIIARQSKSSAAESAVKLTVFKTDETAEAEAPAQATPEPTKRETAKAAPAKVEEVNDVLKKWSKK